MGSSRSFFPKEKSNYDHMHYWFIKLCFYAIMAICLVAYCLTPRSCMWVCMHCVVEVPVRTARLLLSQTNIYPFVARLLYIATCLLQQRSFNQLVDEFYVFSIASWDLISSLRSNMRDVLLIDCCLLINIGCTKLAGISSRIFARSGAKQYNYWFPKRSFKSYQFLF